LVLILVFGLLLLNVVFFQHGYWRHYPVEFSREWEYGYRPAIEYLTTVENQYDQVWFTQALGRPYIFFLFYLKTDPRQFQEQAIISKDAYGFVKVESFDKYHFFKDSADIESEGEVVLVDLSKNVPEKYQRLKTIKLLNGEPLLVIHDFQLTPEYLEKQKQP
jgi:hypothetical protein